MPYIEIKLRDIIFDPEVQSYCVNSNFKCPNYKHSWACPPEAPYLEKEVSTFSKFFLIYYKSDLNKYIQKIKLKHPNQSESIIKNKLLMSNFLRDKLEKEMFKFLSKFQGKYDQKLVLWDGYCRVCYNQGDKECNYDSGASCRYPNEIRYSMEAVGIDVTKTVKNVDLNIEWPPINYVYRFGLICIK
ncbi:MAG: DUF2284 domain-containing protein [Promethearchaeota archaeon]